MNNVVEKFKKGHKIHIKESLKGSFTKWCGGNVTNECILRGKNSSNPKIRKKATFADNARRWKHRKGGILKASFGQTLNKIGDWFKNNKDTVSNGLSIVNLVIPSIIGGNKLITPVNNISDNTEELNIKLLLANNLYENAKNMLLDPNNSHAFGSEIFDRKLKYLYEAPILALYKKQISDNKKLLEEQNRLNKINTYTNTALSLLQLGIGMLGSKKENNSSNSYLKNYIDTQYKNYGTFNADGSMNMGNGLGTFDIKNGYKSKQYTIKNI